MSSRAANDKHVRDDDSHSVRCDKPSDAGVIALNKKAGSPCPCCEETCYFSQPLIVGSFLHCSAVGLSAFSAANECNRANRGGGESGRDQKPFTSSCMKSTHFRLDQIHRSR